MGGAMCPIKMLSRSKALRLLTLTNERGITMAKKTVGNAYHYSQKKIDRLITEMDRRTKTGKDRENVDPTWQKHRLTAQGERVWSF
jgi:hypothetical protein